MSWDVTVLDKMLYLGFAADRCVNLRSDHLCEIDGGKTHTSTSTVDQDRLRTISKALPYESTTLLTCPASRLPMVISECIAVAYGKNMADASSKLKLSGIFTQRISRVIWLVENVFRSMTATRSPIARALTSEPTRRIIPAPSQPKGRSSSSTICNAIRMSCTYMLVSNRWPSSQTRPFLL